MICRYRQYKQNSQKLIKPCKARIGSNRLEALQGVCYHLYKKEKSAQADRLERFWSCQSDLNWLPGFRRVLPRWKPYDHFLKIRIAIGNSADEVTSSCGG